MTTIIDKVFEDGIKGAGMCFLLVLAYKVYKMKLTNEMESNCCEGFKWKFTSQNSGGNELDQRLGDRISNAI